MHNQLTYINSINQSISFWSDDIVFNFGDLWSYSWDYSKDYNKIRNFSRTIVTKKFTARLYSDNRGQTANEIYELFERDIANEKAGKLIVNGYYMKGYVTSIDVKQKLDVVDLTIKFSTDEPFWVKETETVFIETQSGFGLDYPYDYPHDYTNSLNISILNNNNYTSSDFRLIIFGQCTNPTITIGGHAYSVAVEVGEGEYLTIDSYNKTIYLTKNDGTKINEFANRDLDNYIFEKIPSGQSNVSWTDGIDRFTVTLIEKRSEPKWT